MKVKDPIIELLAIKLYEHDDSSGGWPPATNSRANWMYLDVEMRDHYRAMAQGKRTLKERGR